MDLFITSSGSAQPTFASSTLILPIVSLANLPQLCGDLLIHTFNLRLVGILSSRDHVPLAGALDTADQSQTGVLSPVEGELLSEARAKLMRC